jgi:hypothetical protein
LAAKLHVFSNGTLSTPQILAYENASDTARIQLMNSNSASKSWLQNGFIHATVDSMSLYSIQYGSTSNNIFNINGNNKVGVLTQNPRTRFDVNGDIAWRSATLTLNNGDNNNINVETQKFSYYRVVGPTGAFAVGGFQGASDGRVLTLYNTTAYAMTVYQTGASGSAGTSAPNRIITGAGADIVISAGGAVTFQYSVADTKWVVISTNNMQNASGAYWTTSGNGSTSPSTNYLGTSDAIDFVIRTDNTERMRVLANGTVNVNNGAYVNPGAGRLMHVRSNNDDVALEVKTYGGVGKALTVFVNATDSVGDGIEVTKNGKQGKGVSILMGSTNTDFGLYVAHSGTGRAANIQQGNAASTNPAIFASHAGNSRVIIAQNSLSNAFQPVGFFSQASSGNTVAYAQAAAVMGTTNGIRGGYFLANAASANTRAVIGDVTTAGDVAAVGVYGSGVTTGTNSIGVYGVGAAYGVYAQGNLGASGTKSFAIDHPLDPENKILKHYSAESPEVLNIYRGNIVLGTNGEAEVQLPDYFNAINREFSYVLTPIGAPANLYVKAEVTTDGKFIVAGGTAGMKVSWYVYAERNDVYVQQHSESKAVEVDKNADQKGKYLMPSLYNQPDDKGIHYNPPYKPYAPEPVQEPNSKDLD